MKQRSEPATPRRLRQAREQGDHPVSAALIGAASVALFAGFAPAATRALESEVTGLLRAALTSAEPAVATALLRPVVALSLPIVGLCAAGALVAGLAQTGGFVSFRLIRWDFERMNPLARLRAPATGAAGFSLLRAALAVAALLALTAGVFQSLAASLPVALGDAGAALRLAGAAGQRLLAAGAALLLAVALVDWLAVRARWLARHRMSREEVARERRENEGDPEQKRLRQRVYHEWLEGGELGLTARAALIVVGPPRFATALQYVGEQMEAPRVLIQAPGALGRALLVAAYDFRVPVWHDPELAQRLAAVPAGELIPSDCYAAVAAALVQSGGMTGRDAR